MKNNIALCLVMVFLMVFDLNLFAGIELSIYSNNGDNVETSNFPIYSAKFKVLKNGVQYKFNKSEMLIYENTWTTTPIEVSDIDSQGWQTVKWFTEERGYYIKNLTIVYFYFSIADETVLISGSHSPCDIAIIQMVDDNLGNSIDYNFGKPANGETVLKRTRVYAPCGLFDKIDTTKELPIKIDSVKTHSNSFTWEWYGSLADKTPPPVGIYSPLFYNIFLRFKQTDGKYIRDKLTVYFEGGLKREINLIGNYFPIETNTILQLIQPNGGEILTPCQQYEIKWKGQNTRYPVIIEYSIDGGLSWTEIDKSRDTSYFWTVPVAPSENAMVRVRQSFQSSSSAALELNGITASKIKFNSTSSKLLSAMQNGKIIEWDMSNYSISNTYSLGDYSYPSTSIYATGLEYISEDKFILSYCIISNDIRKDSLAFFDIKDNTPYLKIALDNRYSVKSICVDSKKEMLAIVPNVGNQILLYDLKTAKFKNPITYSSPVGCFAFNPKLAEAVSILMNGQSFHYNLPDFTVKNNYDLSGMPVIAKIGFSPNGKFIALGCYSPLPTQITNTKTQVHVFDVDSKQIVRSYLKMESDPVALEFNPTSTLLVVGSQTLPQIAFWDLVTDQYIGNLDKANLRIVDLQFANDGRTVASISKYPDALQVKTFIYPETDKSDACFKIVQPIVTIKPAEFAPNYIGYDVEQVFETVLCNDGIVPVVLSGYWWNQNIHFRLKTELFPVTLAPKECLHIPLIFNPIDTGAVNDSLYIAYCSGNYTLPVTGIGIGRNISFFNENLNFGEVCVGSSIEKEVLVAKNEDPVPLKVNKALISENFISFSVINSPIDTILQSGETLKLKIKFHPYTFGDITSILTIKHSNAEKFDASTKVKGFGLGSKLTLSHQNLMFIPEILERKISISNRANNIVVIESASFEPEGLFSINSTFPLSIPALGNTEINVIWNGETFDNAKLTFNVLPCVSQNFVSIGIYKGNSTLSVPNVSADPREETSIKVEYSNTENKPYNGTRFFEGAVALNPRIFFPTAISSEYGAAQILSNTIQNDRRIISFRVEGDFPRSGVLAEIKGFAALAEIDTSIITVPDNFPHWGSTILTSSKNGLFQLINLCGARRINQNSNKIAILSIAPNPVKEYFKLEFETTMTDNSIIEIYDGLGNLIYKNELQIVKSGKNEIDINAASLLSGNYKLIVRQGTEIAVSSFAIIR